MKNYVKNENDLTVTITLTEEEFDNHFCFCADCGQLLFTSEAIRIDGDWYCQGCTTTCDYCGCIIPIQDSYKAEDSDYDYCYTCYMEETYRCDDCGRRFRYDDSLHEVNEHWYCHSCFEDHRPIIADYHSMKEYSDIIFHGDADRRNELHIGIEIETDSEHRVNRERIAGGVKDILGDFVNIENDGSLNYGFEIITHPATLNYHLSMMTKYKATFEYLIDNDMRGHDISTTGMHHHIDRRFFGSKEDSSIAKIMYLMEKFHREFKTFARRTDAQCADWCRSRKQNYNGKAGWIKQAVMESKEYSSYQQRYYNLNLTNANTIEVRLWKSTHNSQTFEATIKFTVRLAKLCRDTRAVDLAKYSFDQLLGDDPTILAYWNRINNK